MNTNIFKCDSSGTITQLAVYSLEPENALIAWIHQNLRNDFNTWNYPKHMNRLLLRRQKNRYRLCRLPGAGILKEKREVYIYGSKFYEIYPVVLLEEPHGRIEPES